LVIADCLFLSKVSSVVVGAVANRLATLPYAYYSAQWAAIKGAPIGCKFRGELGRGSQKAPFAAQLIDNNNK